MTGLITNVIGFLAAFLGVLITAPQLIKSLRTKKVRDVSSGMLLIFLLNCVVQTIYGLLIDALPIIICNQIGFVVIFVEFILKVKYSGNK